MDRDPTQLQSEINQLIKKQLDTLGREIFGGVTDAEHREYEQRQRRIDGLYGETPEFKICRIALGNLASIKKGSLACDRLFQCGNSPRVSSKTSCRHDAGARGSTAGHTILNDALPTPSLVVNNKPGISLLLSGRAASAFLASRTKLANTVQVSVGQLFN
jgi:hypothetical protein